MIIIIYRLLIFLYLISYFILGVINSFSKSCFFFMCVRSLWFLYCSCFTFIVRRCVRVLIVYNNYTNNIYLFSSLFFRGAVIMIIFFLNVFFFFNFLDAVYEYSWVRALFVLVSHSYGYGIFFKGVGGYNASRDNSNIQRPRVECL